VAFVLFRVFAIQKRNRNKAPAPLCNGSSKPAGGMPALPGAQQELLKEIKNHLARIEIHEP